MFDVLKRGIKPVYFVRHNIFLIKTNGINVLNLVIIYRVEIKFISTDELSQFLVHLLTNLFI
jgi:hypothetical protein